MIIGIGIWLARYIKFPNGVLAQIAGAGVAAGKLAATRSGDFEGRVNLYRNAQVAIVPRRRRIAHACRQSPNTSTMKSETPFATFGWSVKVGCGIHKYVQFDTTLHTIEIAEGGLQLRDDIVAAQMRAAFWPSSTWKSLPNCPIYLNSPFQTVT